MINRLLMVAGLAGLCATVLPDLANRYLDTSPVKPARPAAAIATGSATPPSAVTGSREVVLAAGPNGHFQTVLEMNGRAVSGLIDTGATAVAINESTARRIGLSLSTLDYSLPVSTANGQTMGAAVTVKRIRIGSIAVDNVEALVLPDTALSGTLIGMSFLNRLSAFGVEAGALRLRR